MWQDDALAIIDCLRLGAFRKRGEHDRAALTALFTQIENVAPLAFLANRDSEKKLHYLTSGGKGTPWAFHL